MVLVTFPNHRFIKRTKLIAFLAVTATIYITLIQIYRDENIIAQSINSLYDSYFNQADYDHPLPPAVGEVSLMHNGGVNYDIQGEQGEGFGGLSQDSIAVWSFFNDVFDLLLTSSPKGKSKRRYREECNLHGDVGNGPDNYGEWWKLTYDELANCLEVSKSEKRKLNRGHRKYVQGLSKLVLPRGTYTGSGIVTVAGGKYTLMALLVIETLRSTGTTLPVEVFIPPDESRETEAAFCDELLPQYNAKCIYIDDILSGDMIDKFEFKGYQFKSLALLASSFENVLFLDADNFPIKPLDGIFDREPFTSTGLVLWPDFWRRTTNPVFYDITDLKVDRTRRVRNSVDDLTPVGVYNPPDNNLGDVPLHDFEGAMPDPSTESGQIMVNKNKHLGTVLLSLYYNVNGPNWYYPILSQRAAGEGDKETFIAAAMFYGLPFYQVKTPVGVDGYFHQVVETDEDGNEHRKTGDFRGVAMLQHDFVQDYEMYQVARQNVSREYPVPDYATYDPYYTVQQFVMDYFGANFSTMADTMFVHANLPKFDIVEQAISGDFIENGEPLRAYTALYKIQYFDMELHVARLFDKLLCSTESHRHYFSHITTAIENERVSWSQICEYIYGRLQFLTRTHDKATERVVDETSPVYREKQRMRHNWKREERGSLRSV